MFLRLFIVFLLALRYSWNSCTKNFTASSHVATLKDILTVLSPLPSFRNLVYQSLTYSCDSLPRAKRRTKLYSAMITATYWNILTAFLYIHRIAETLFAALENLRENVLVLEYRLHSLFEPFLPGYGGWLYLMMISTWSCCFVTVSCRHFLLKNCFPFSKKLFHLSRCSWGALWLFILNHFGIKY